MSDGITLAAIVQFDAEAIQAISAKRIDPELGLEWIEYVAYCLYRMGASRAMLSSSNHEGA